MDEIFYLIFKVLGVAAIVFVFVRHILPSLLWLLGAAVAFTYHVRVAKVHGVPTAPILANAPRHIFCAWMEKLDYGVTLRDPDLSYHYREGTSNHITNNEPWLDQLATALYRKRTIIRLDICKNGSALQLNETLDLSVATLPAGAPGEVNVRAMFVYPESNVVESLIGFDLQRMLKTVNHYMPDVECLIVVRPRSMVDGKYNTIEYLSTLTGTWIDSDHLSFPIPRG